MKELTPAFIMTPGSEGSQPNHDLFSSLFLLFLPPNNNSSITPVNLNKKKVKVLTSLNQEVV